MSEKVNELKLIFERVKQAPLKLLEVLLTYTKNNLIMIEARKIKESNDFENMIGMLIDQIRQRLDNFEKSNTLPSLGVAPQNLQMIYQNRTRQPNLIYRDQVMKLKQDLIKTELAPTTTTTTLTMTTPAIFTTPTTTIITSTSSTTTSSTTRSSTSARKTHKSMLNDDKPTTATLSSNPQTSSILKKFQNGKFMQHFFHFSFVLFVFLTFKIKSQL